VAEPACRPHAMAGRPHTPDATADAVDPEREGPVKQGPNGTCEWAIGRLAAPR